MLLEEYLKPRGITQVELAARMGVPIQRVNAIINGKRGITAETAILLHGMVGVPGGAASGASRGKERRPEMQGADGWSGGREAGPAWRWAARVAAPLAAVLVSAGFFGTAFVPGLRVVLYLGAALAIFAALATGIGLLAAAGGR